MNGNQIHFYGDIAKFDSQADGSLMVSGIASTESVDAQGETITADCMRKAIPSFLQCGAVREMHQPIAAGRPISAHVDDDGKTHFTAHVVDSETVKKVIAGVLKGFSIGGKAIRKIGKVVHEMSLKEISLVDLPCNSECTFSVIKFDENKPADTDDESMNTELVEKVESLTETVKTLTATVNTLAGTVKTISESAAPADKLEKAILDIGEIQKRANETLAQVQTAERNSIIEKMATEGRVVYGEDGVAMKRDDLVKMDFGLLKFAAKNSATIPTAAKAIYCGEDDKSKAIDPKIKGDERIEKSYGGKYDDLDAMVAANPL